MQTDRSTESKTALPNRFRRTILKTKTNFPRFFIVLAVIFLLTLGASLLYSILDRREVWLVGSQFTQSTANRYYSDFYDILIKDNKITLYYVNTAPDELYLNKLKRYFGVSEIILENLAYLDRSWRIDNDSENEIDDSPLDYYDVIK